MNEMNHMNLVLLNLKSKQQIEIDDKNPLIIGRKTIVNCTDKRISRNHGKITYIPDGKVKLSALHSNPCFFTKNGTPPIVQLNKDEEQILSEGDCLGLLPDSFWFQITAKQNCSKTDDKKLPESNLNFQNNVICDVETSNLVVPELYVDSNKTVSENKISKTKDDNSFNENSSDNKTAISSAAPLPPSEANTSQPSTSINTNSWGYGSAEFEKTRRLPLWRYKIDEPEDYEKYGTNKSSKLFQKTVVPTAKKPKLETEIESNEKEFIESIKNGSVNSSENTSAPSVPISGEPSVKEPDPKRNCQYQKKDGYESDVKDDESSRMDRRPICQYEKKCYRKNTQHKLDFCHPGDLDYVPYENRPMCQYGANCYRQNKTHKVQFRHPPESLRNVNSVSPSSCSSPSPVSSALPAKRKRKAVKRHGVNSNDGDLNDSYDLDDPFINDASSDEYIPDSEIGEESDSIDLSD